MENIKETPKKPIGVVVYSDGSFVDGNYVGNLFGLSNVPDVSGSSIFGYTYSLDNSVKSKATKTISVSQATASGFFNSVSLTKDGFVFPDKEPKKEELVSPLAYFAYPASFKADKEQNITTNSAFAEAYAMLYFISSMEAIEKNTDYVIKDIKLYTDSAMLCFVLEAIVNNKPVDKYAYPEIYTNLQNYLTAYLQRGKFHYKHIKGHSGDIGNEVADRLSRIARDARYENLIFGISDSHLAKFHYLPVADGEDIFSIPLPKEVNGKDIYYVLDSVYNGDKRTFYIFEYGSSNKKKEVGEKSGSSLIGIYKDKKKDDILDKIIDARRDMTEYRRSHLSSDNEFGILYKIETSVIKKPILGLFHNLGVNLIESKFERDINTVIRTVKEPSIRIKHLKVDEVDTVVRPGAIANVLIDSIANIDEFLNLFTDTEQGKMEEVNLAGQGRMGVIDVTSSFFESKKNSSKLIVPVGVKEVKISVTLDNKTYTPTCILNTDIPDRSTLLRLEKLSNVKIYFFYWIEDIKMIKYGYILDSYEGNDRNTSIWYNKYSSAIWL